MNDMPPMRGREGEFALIRELLAAARRGEGSVLVVQSRAGFGKTTLLQSALEQAAARGLRGHCITPGPGTSAMNPVTTVMTAKNLQNTSKQREQGHHRSNGPSGAARGSRLGYFGRGW